MFSKTFLRRSLLRGSAVRRDDDIITRAVSELYTDQHEPLCLCGVVFSYLCIYELCTTCLRSEVMYTARV